MHTTTLTWDPAAGWSQDPSDLTVVPGATIALAFVDPACDATSALHDLHSAASGLHVVACSTAGQILDRQVDPAPLVAMVLTFSATTVVSAIVENDGRGGWAAGAELGRQLTHDQAHVAGVLVLGGGLRLNGSELVAGLVSALPEGTPLFGGLAADGDRFERTWVYCDGQHNEDCVTAVAFIGEALELRHGSQGGWDGFGPVRTITRSEGNVLYELDGQPALALYKQYLGELAQELPGSALLFPLTVASPDGATSVVRTVLGVDEDAQSMTFAGDVPQTWSARLMWTTTDSLVDGASRAAEQAVQPRTDAAIAVSCVGRRLVLGDRTEEELECVSEVVGAGTPVIGFYSYGEITPVSGHCAMQNQTMTVTTLSERVPADA